MPQKPAKPADLLKLYRVTHDRPVALVEITAGKAVRLSPGRALAPPEIGQLIEDLLPQLPAAERGAQDMRIRTEGMI